jgi:xanthine dehydrogenase molybdopterin-binding subunit B
MMKVRGIKPDRGDVDAWRSLIHESITWKGVTEKKGFRARQLVEKEAGATGMNLTAQAYLPNTHVEMDQYNALVAGLTELTLDGLTGEVEIGRVDCMVEMGDSMNPVVDWGQIHGSWVQGIGHCLCEKRSQPESLGYQVDWFDYHPPSSFEMPMDFRLIIDPDKNVRKIPITIGARSMAEPTVYVGCSSTQDALQMAINAVREDNGRAPQLAAKLPILVDERVALCRAGGFEDPEQH